MVDQGKLLFTVCARGKNDRAARFKEIYYELISFPSVRSLRPQKKPKTSGEWS